MKKLELLSRIGVALAATTLVGASVFAESRPSNETRVRRGEHGRIQRESSGERSRATRRDNSSNERRSSVRRETERSDARVEVRGERNDRSYRNTDRSTNRTERYNRDTNRSSRENREWRDRGSYDRNNRNNSRNHTRNDRYDRNDRNRSYGRSPSYGYGRSNHYRQPYYGHGRVSRVHRYGGGYRVWIVGAPYPFYIPLAYYRHDRFRVGLTIRLGGYYNDGGYYDYYDGYSDGSIRGVVESVDYRRDSFVVRNEATGSFVTILSRDRRLDVRAGDYVELEGEWTRSGVFTAWDVDFLEDGYRR
ncbi:MAG TPA: hypothetical protein VKB93_14485 [Thermoanaerobaculia bacterium]|nr:hypothetical protein [Thermoanaerobaculia bacterium]